MNTETERIWGAGIASLLQALEDVGVKVNISTPGMIVCKHSPYTVVLKKPDTKSGNGVFSVSAGVSEPFKFHFVSNKEALLYLQSIEVSDAWTKAAKSTIRAFS